MKRILFLLLAMIVVLGLGTTVNAYTLEVRGTDSLGRQLIYDPDRNITWYDFSNAANTWENQVNWALGLSVVFGSTTYDDWRLPTALNLDGSGPNSGYNVTGSEMGHLYYTELLNVLGGPLNTGDFQNLLSDFYWSSTEYSALPGGAWAWDFLFFNGYQDTRDKLGNRYGLAVRSGDVAAATSVPEPTTVALLGIGLAGMAVYGVRRRRQHRPQVK